ncbi:hypothetical protein [Roseisalinus antarcticus]|uniref:Transferrin-binding protein B C-lobe/N-lobe beta barrel domain-containing protein n=1 Tax=Roseisalinus antarcticus TaxID=254357 RepID=A0A1Y5SIE4_9RHOB|nr:hypothetical protein [Roseisalinus antarcticus]SLN41552.1 hypothetical protein ROA7023_01666 [Roseisalinus antarcticus]
MIRKTFNFALSAGMAALLCACASGGGGVAPTAIAPTAIEPLGPSFAQSFAQSREIAGRLGLDDDNARASDPANLPTFGTATYDGIAQFGRSLDAPASLVIGRADLTVDFRTRAVSGRVTDMVSQRGRYTGELAIDGGRFDRGAGRRDAAMTLDLDGRISRPGVSARTIDASLLGVFANGGKAIAGFGEGVSRGPDGARPIEAVVAVER